MSNTRIPDEDLSKFLFRITKDYAPIEALASFTTSMLTGGSISDGAVSAMITAASTPLLGALSKYGIFKANPKSPLSDTASFNLNALIASQALFLLLDNLIGCPISHSAFTMNSLGFSAFTTFLTLYQDVFQNVNMMDGKRGSYIRGLGRF